MIIIQLTGGLGNQMFQYAFARSICKQNSFELALDINNQSLNLHNGFELDRIFNIKTKKATDDNLKQVSGFKHFELTRKISKKLRIKKYLLPNFINDEEFLLQEDKLVNQDNIIYNGAWQSERFFQSIEKTIRSDFTFAIPLDSKNKKLSDEICGIDAVSIHIRRNDYVNNPLTHSIHGTCSLEYYQKAIHYISRKVKKPQFYIFSDDIEWAQKNIHIDFPCHFINHNQGSDSYKDMLLMSKCRHNIIANSTFSWWGAWLNNFEHKIVIAPEKWFVTKKNLHQIIPDCWVTL